MNFAPKKIAVLDHNTPARRRVRRIVKDENGVDVEVTERVPWQRFFKAVNPAGAVVRIPLHTHRANTEAQDPYKVHTEYAKVRKGFVPYGQCPQTLPYDVQVGHIDGYGPVLPPSLRSRPPCSQGAKGGAISADNCCQCVEDLIAYRKAAQATKMQKLEIRTAEMLQAEASKDMASAVKDIVGVVADLKSKVDQPAAKRQSRSNDD